MKCWQCGLAAEAGAVFCAACKTLLPPDPTIDHFARLGLERRFAQDADQIAAQHRQRQRQVHPDRFVGRGERMGVLSMQHATALNDAVRVLRDPVRRADYLLTLRGVSMHDDRGVKLDPAFLMEVIELREAIEELTGTDAHVERSRLGREIAARYEATLSRLGEGLDAPADAAPPLDALARLAAQLKYLRRMLDELGAGDP
ncbi:MAG: Fe-S protein assembly co-chaperone HscB [Myxococcales bacterium]|nr:Fe-S protein assembly co-chaperone HscB [Myxococcales bacterium]